MVTEPAYKSRKTGEQKPGSITKSDQAPDSQPPNTSVNNYSLRESVVSANKGEDGAEAKKKGDVDMKAEPEEETVIT